MAANLSRRSGLRFSLTRADEALSPNSRQLVRLLMLTILLGLTQSLTASAQAVADACMARIPATVAQALTQRFPDHRLPLVTDSLDEDVRFEREKGRSGCLLVASDDFDGDGQKDFAVGLVPKKGQAPLVAIALNRKNEWLTTTVESWGRHSFAAVRAGRAARRLQKNQSGPWST